MSRTRTAPKTRRPDMGAYFRARIDYHVHGMLAGSTPRLPADVKRVVGDVDDRFITVTTTGGDTFVWTGNRFAARKVHGCYAPLMPQPVPDAPTVPAV